MIECFIPAAQKDYNKLPYVLASIARNLPDVGRVHISSPTKIDLPPFYKRDVRLGQLYIHQYRDDSVLTFDKSLIPYRPNWVYQQFLKLFQSVTFGDLYLVMDADIIVNRPIELFSGTKPILLLGRDQNHPPYFKFSNAMLGIGKVYPHSFLSEMTVYSRYSIDAMLEAAGCAGPYSFCRKAASIITNDCYPAESELYGSFIMHSYPDLYEIRNIKSDLHGQYNGHIWTPEEIETLSAEMKQRPEVDIFSIHTWEGKIT